MAAPWSTFTLIWKSGEPQVTYGSNHRKQNYTKPIVTKVLPRRTRRRRVPSGRQVEVVFVHSGIEVKRGAVVLIQIRISRIHSRGRQKAWRCGCPELLLRPGTPGPRVPWHRAAPVRERTGVWSPAQLWPRCGFTPSQADLLMAPPSTLWRAYSPPVANFSGQRTTWVEGVSLCSVHKGGPALQPHSEGQTVDNGRIIF